MGQPLRARQKCLSFVVQAEAEYPKQQNRVERSSRRPHLLPSDSAVSPEKSGVPAHGVQPSLGESVCA